MSTVAQLVRAGGKGILSTTRTASVFAALETMAHYDVGALVVLDEGRLAGLFTERDYARKGIVQGRAARECSVGELMSEAVVVRPECTIQEAQAMMAARGRRVRYLVVADGEQLLGLVSIGDLVKSQMADQQHLIETLEHYIASP